MGIKISRLFDRKKYRRAGYFLSHFAHCYLRSNAYYRAYKNRCYDLLSDQSIAEDVYDRLHYYNRMSRKFSLELMALDCTTRNAPQVMHARDLSQVNIPTMYRCDLLRHLKSFSDELMISFEAGDVTRIPDVCRIVKSRPITPVGQNNNSVLMKLDRLRHFNFINDPYRFEDKKNKLVWRGVAYQPHRRACLEKCFELPCCNIAQVGNANEYAFGNYLSLGQQLCYKYILCIEGNDVATNLKWAMSSRSLCFMNKPKYETWFMEGRLQAGVHYVELAPDYSDLSEKIAYYNANPDLANKIIDNANKYVNQFRYGLKEDLISLLVLEKFFYLSGQLDSELMRSAMQFQS